MANQVEILSLNIDVQQLTQRLAQTRQQIEQLQASQRSLTQSGQGASQQFVQQSAQLRTLQQNYNSQLNVVTQLNSANAQATSATQAVNTALNVNVTSIAEATENSRQLTAVRNQLNLATQEGQDALALINARLQENTEFIRTNVTAQEQQRMAIGDYSSQIQDALSNLNPFNGGIQGFTQRAQAAGGAGALLTQSFQGLTQGLIGATRAGLAFLATPIGAAIGLLAVAVGVVVGAFKFMTASMNSTEEGSQKLAKVTATITGVFNGLWKLIKPLGEYIGGAFVEAFELATDVVDAAVGTISAGLKFLGFDDAAESVDNFSNSISQSVKETVALAEAEGKLDQMQRKSKLTQLEAQRQAEKIRQQRDDESKSISERIALNNQLGEVLKKQLADELVIAQQALKVANLRIQAEGKSKEALDQQADALGDIADIQERITSQESEQLSNQNSLRKEAADAEKERQAKAQEARQKAIDKAIQQNKDEIDLFVAQQGFKKKALQDELKFEEDLSKKRIALLQREHEAGKMSKSAFEAEKLNISNEFLKKQSEAVVSEAQRELDLYKKSIEQKKADDSFYTEEKMLAKMTENNNLAMMERDFQLKQFEAGLINEQAYNDAVNEINNQNRIKNEEAENLRTQAKKEQSLIDLENQRILDEENFINEFDLQLERERIRFEAEKSAAEKNGADISLIEKKHAQATAKIQDEKESKKRAEAAETFGNIAQLLGQETVAGKAAGIAQATMNVWQGVSNVWGAKSTLPEPFATASKVANTAVVVSSGLQAVKKISGVNIPSFADGGQIPTLREGVINNGANLEVPLSNGDDTLAYVGQGELILSRKTQQQMGGSRFFSQFNIPGFANGGMVGGYSEVGSAGGFKIDLDLLASKIGKEVGNANLLLPPPITILDEITTAQSSVQAVRDGATL